MHHTHDVETATTDDDRAELARRIEGIRFAMVTLPDEQGRLHGRPLTVQSLAFDGSLWFLVSSSAEWVGAVGLGSPAHASLTDGDARWVSITGTARLVEDRGRIEELWSPLYAAWFDGPDDPDLTLLRIDADHADYWDSDAGRVVRLARMVKAAVTGDASDLGERGRLDP